MTKEEKTQNAVGRIMIIGGLVGAVFTLAMWHRLAFLAPIGLMVVGTGFLISAPTRDRDKRLYKIAGIAMFFVAAILLIAKISGL